MADCKLSNNLVEGFLYTYLSHERTIDQIYEAILERFGEEVCASSDLNSKGIPKYKSKTRRVLVNGKYNGIYLFNEANNKYRIPE